MSLVTIVVAHEDIACAALAIPIAGVSRRDDDSLAGLSAPAVGCGRGTEPSLERSDPPKSRWLAVKGDDPVIIRRTQPLELVLAAHGRRSAVQRCLGRALARCSCRRG